MSIDPSAQDDSGCPLPMRDYPEITLAHGGGGELSGELIRELFLPAFGSDPARVLGDAAVLSAPGKRLAMSTDSYVVRPLFFPGGSIGDLAVNGTVNDLAMVGARPLWMSVGFIIEEGFAMSNLKQVADQLGAAARRAKVSIVTGDTKVVERGHGDGCYINTCGVGVVPEGLQIAPDRARPGDAIILSGTIGDHGMAVMSVREGLEFETEIKSDSAPLAEMVASMLEVCSAIHVMRDPTRGGLGAALNEIASASGVGIEIDERRLPIKTQVASACEILGLDPLLVANEGKLVCIAPAENAAALVAAMRSSPFGGDATIIGAVTDQHPRRVVGRTPIGATRVITTPVGEQLPRIC